MTRPHQDARSASPSLSSHSFTRTGCGACREAPAQHLQLPWRSRQNLSKASLPPGEVGLLAVAGGAVGTECSELR